MKAFLMYRDRDFDMDAPPVPREDDLIQDLELPTLFAAMAGDDKLLGEVASKAVLASTTDVATILYRQEVLKDALKWEAAVREIYSLAVETLEVERKNYLGFGFRYPNGILQRSVDVLQMLADMLLRLRRIADQHAGGTFQSDGFRRLFAMLRSELSDAYFATVRQHLKQLKFHKGALVSAQLGQGNKGCNYVLRKENPPQGKWIDRLLAARPPAYSFQLPERDDSGARALSDLRDRGINLVANAAAQSVDHIKSFFRMLRTELAFYVGCLNLRGQLAALDEPICFPEPAGMAEGRFSGDGLYDACLALRMRRKAVGNDVAADGKDLLIITGANQGGKSTFLRSIGLSRLMMQCGMFVPAERLTASVCERIFTHYKREEDATMTSGKFDEELSRMSDVADHLRPGCLVLFNESFASTNEREGSEIARQVVTALIERGVRVCFVTHQYEFAHTLYARKLPEAMFLRAGREESGARTFKITAGEPLPMSYGEDLYNEIFLRKAAA